MAERVRCGWEALDDLLAEPNIQDLILAYWEELSPVKAVAPIAPDWPAMRAAEAAGRFKVWACRVEGTLAGFVAWHIFPHLMYGTTLFAIDGGFYLAPAYRDSLGRAGYKMWKTVEPALRALGVKVIMSHDNATRPLLPFFLGLGYTPRSVIYWKVLGDDGVGPQP